MSCRWLANTVWIAPTWNDIVNCVQGGSQHGARRQLPPLQCSPEMGSAPIMAVAWLWGYCLSRLLLCQSHSPVTVCRSLVVCTVVDLFYCKIYLLAGARRAKGRTRAALPSQSPSWGTMGHRHRGPAKCFDT